MHLDTLIELVTTRAQNQHGLIRTVDVPEEDRRRLRYLASRGLLERVGNGVYRIAGAPPTWLQKLQAGVWALGPTALVSHAAAARLHGFDRFVAERIDLQVGRSHRNRSLGLLGATVHSTMDRQPSDGTRAMGLPVTTADRTILDLARARTSRTQLEAAIDSAVRLRLTTLDRIIDRLADLRGPRRWGAAQLDALLMTSGGHTLLERRFLQLVRRARLPTPEPQVVHRMGGRHVARVDFLFRDHGVVVEVSGGRGHSSPSERAKDARRRNELQQLGRVVLEFTFEQVTQDPDLVIRTLSAALAVSRP